MLGTDNATVALVRLALDAASLRHAAIAGNIANAGSAGHVRQQVNFEQQLGFARQTLAAGGSVSAATLAGVEPFVEAAPVPRSALGTASSSLDGDMVQLSQNTLRYQALARALGRHTAILAIATTEGRR